MSEAPQQLSVLDNLYQMFVHVKTNRNQELSYDGKCYRLFGNNEDIKKFSKLYQSQLGFSENTMKGMFKACDTDNNGKITVAEFAALASIVVDGTVEQKLGFLFAVFDNDESGTLDFGELDLICKSIVSVGKHGGKSDAEIKEITDNLHKADTNGDGTITIDEWIGYGLSNQTISSLLGH
ncbi:hypothetical protein PPL_03390 [Heterostelium album PN500]|uniref:EF-hand domain-containing protein n=1 Tax=Heterostelium pallidum (strain ATCC 26659 / Pp 5 / PN500) TaxID=670386 RepID=D3B4R4_HETP5|nr:hypothetical protein PPL_03390 [Heterostelium album PN500]EFA84312.1 hypothetical protein PPL_03390 [Heterostelium album PN500]|eukprot:XP_020436427.1 hypothetical protein PPL_03390 [Heterostelium album PN500]